jgi:hypothetical protein
MTGRSVTQDEFIIFLARYPRDLRRDVSVPPPLPHCWDGAYSGPGDCEGVVVDAGQIPYGMGTVTIPSGP